MHHWRPSLLLSLLLILLIAVRPWPVAAGHASGNGCREAAVERSAVTAHGCCDGHPEHSQHPSCGDSYCPAGHCSALSFLPATAIYVSSSVPPANEALAVNGYASHLSPPSIPPPIVRSLS
jgi:hypothetical protein